MKQIKPTRRKQTIIAFIIMFLIVSSYSVLIAYRYGIFRDEHKGNPISIRVSNVNWEIDNVTSDSYPDQTRVTFKLEMEVWVKGSSNVTYTHTFPSSFYPGFKSSFTGFTTVTMTTIAFSAEVIEHTYPPGSSYFSRQIRVWINRKNVTDLPNGLFDFWFGRSDDTVDIYHTYLRISIFGMKISNDPMPEAWGEIDWAQQEWGSLD